MAELLRRHWDTAVLLAGRVLGSPDLARDAAQEAAVAAMTDLERLRAPDRFGAWFCGIALNVSRRWRRQLQSEAPGLGPDPAAASAIRKQRPPGVNALGDGEDRGVSRAEPPVGVSAHALSLGLGGTVAPLRLAARRAHVACPGFVLARRVSCGL
jgi:DNA-directed RNA polymerase specialized sigma24 family protein